MLRTPARSSARILDLSGTPEEVGFLEDSPIRTPEDQLRPPFSPTALSRPHKNKTYTQEGRSVRTAEASADPPTYGSRTAEAKACLTKAKYHLGISRNTKTSIKTEVTSAIERLYQLVKEAEEERNEVGNSGREGKGAEEKLEKRTEMEEELVRKLEEHAGLIRRNEERMEELRSALEKQKESLEGITYASVAASETKRVSPQPTALHSVVVSSRDEIDTGEDVLGKIREVVDAKEGWVKVERVRKAKDQKVIIGCSTAAEREKVKERLSLANDRLTFEDVKNKDPLLILRDVLSYNSDDDILGALRKQNRDLFNGIPEEDFRSEVRFRRKARNLQTKHVIMRVSPRVWSRAVEAGALYIDLQKIRVADFSPLVQCSLCLGYGHGRRFCKETAPRCSHCGGPHMKTECEGWLSNASPSCCNCTDAKMDRTEHNAFSTDCPVRCKWDALARASIAYC